MILYPAIDILDGRAVRLTQGDFNRATQYSTPLDAAREWAAAGAKRLHVVDLDGARAGAPANLAHVEQIAAQTGLEIQLGGGLRSRAAIADAIAAGVARVVLGTAAFADGELLDARARRARRRGSSCRSTRAAAGSPRPAGPRRPR